MEKYVYLLDYRGNRPTKVRLTFSIHETLEGAIKGALNFMHTGFKYYALETECNEPWTIDINVSDFTTESELIKVLHKRICVWKKGDQYLEIIQKNLEK